MLQGFCEIRYELGSYLLIIYTSEWSRWVLKCIYQGSYSNGVDTFVRVGGLECKCEVRGKKYRVKGAPFFFTSKNYTNTERNKCIIHMLANQFVLVVWIFHIK